MEHDSCECICNHHLPSRRVVVGVTNLGRNCSLKYISDLISKGWIRVSQKSANSVEVQRLQVAASPMEDSVTDDKRSLDTARGQLRKLLEVVDHLKATSGVSAEPIDLGLENIKVVAALPTVNAVGLSERHGEGVMGVMEVIEG